MENATLTLNAILKMLQVDKRYSIVDWLEET